MKDLEKLTIAGFASALLFVSSSAFAQVGVAGDASDDLATPQMEDPIMPDNTLAADGDCAGIVADGDSVLQDNDSTSGEGDIAARPAVDGCEAVTMDGGATGGQDGQGDDGVVGIRTDG